jgi:hypothetical protein
MDSDFINLYITKQKNLISELQSKLLVAETTVDLLKDSNSKLAEEKSSLTTELEKITNKKQKQISKDVETF